MAVVRSESVRNRSGLFDIPDSDQIDGYLGRQVEFTEDGSMSMLKAERRGRRFKATYHPEDCSDDIGNSMRRSNRRRGSSISDPLPGLAVLDGWVEVVHGRVTVSGVWRHIDNLLEEAGRGATGSFEMRSSSRKSGNEFVGWWKFDTCGEPHIWQWDKIGHRDLPTRIVESVWMDRYGMVCAWLFLFMTSIQLASIASQWDGLSNRSINQAFNVVYAVCYTSFLVAYSISSTAKNWLYTLGVALYTIGYFVFAAIHSGTDGQASLYHAGSWLFLIGSLLLMCSSAPSGGGRWYAYSPFRIQSTIWWGSTLFLLGSITFACDAIGLGDPVVNAVLGLCLFTAGRCLFVVGSQTPRCTIVFCGVGELRRMFSWSWEVCKSLGKAIRITSPRISRATSSSTGRDSRALLWRCLGLAGGLRFLIIRKPSGAPSRGRCLASSLRPPRLVSCVGSGPPTSFWPDPPRGIRIARECRPGFQGPIAPAGLV